MFRKFALKKTAHVDSVSTLENIHDWVLSLPWVTERPHALAAGVRMFGVDCEPLGVSRLWLVTGLGPQTPALSSSLAVVLPLSSAQMAQDAGWGAFRVPMPANHVLVQAEVGTELADIEALVLTAYGCAMSSEGGRDSSPESHGPVSKDDGTA